MSLFDGVRTLADTLLMRERPPCKRCHEAGRDIRMEADEVWDPSQCLYADAWVCPECERQVYRGDDPGLTAPDGERL